MRPAIYATGVTVEIDGARLLDDVDLTVGAGDWVNVVGPNGAGQVDAAARPRRRRRVRGRIELLGRPLEDLDRRARGRLVALVPQRPELPTGDDRGALRAARPDAAPRSARRRSAARPRGRRPRHRAARPRRSGRTHAATRCRAGSVSASCSPAPSPRKPPLLLLDEPTTALDVGHQQDVLELVDRLRHELGLTVVSTMHDLTLAAQYGDHIVLLDGGRVAASGPPVQVLTGPHVATHYGARVDVIRHAGSLVVVPVASPVHQPRSGGPRCPNVTPPTSPPTTRVPTTSRGPRRSCSSTPAPGKGKTTAAMGVVMRGVGRGWPVAVVQFLKSGNWHTGEEKVGRQLGVDWWAMGEGFTWDSADLTVDQAVAAGAWDHARGADRRRRPPARRPRRDHLSDELGVDRHRRRDGDHRRAPTPRQRRVHRSQRAARR